MTLGEFIVIGFIGMAFLIGIGMLVIIRQFRK